MGAFSFKGVSAQVGTDRVILILNTRCQSDLCHRGIIDDRM
jgi:hypothetical protein